MMCSEHAVSSSSVGPAGHKELIKALGCLSKVHRANFTHLLVLDTCLVTVSFFILLVRVTASVFTLCTLNGWGL